LQKIDDNGNSGYGRAHASDYDDYFFKCRPGPAAKKPELGDAATVTVCVIF
jgi:hypothetical protein